MTQRTVILVLLAAVLAVTGCQPSPFPTDPVDLLTEVAALSATAEASETQAAVSPTASPTVMSPTASVPPPTATAVPAGSTATAALPTETPASTETPAPAATPIPPTPIPAPFLLTSAAFEEGGAIPVQYTCDGENVSLPLAWTDPPEGTQSLALIVDDPDAQSVAGFTWIHWVLFNIPAGARGLPEGVPLDATLADGTVHGNSSWKRVGYGGPCPPNGEHRYYHKLYALDAMLDLDAGATAADLEAAMEGHVLGQVELIGRYARP